MHFWVGITDKEWFEYLSGRSPDEVNFWQPSAKRRAAALDAGVPFLIKLHAPLNYIVGGGFFMRYSALPARVAWEAFGEKNGVADYLTLRRRIEQYRKERVTGDPEIGCNVLTEPFFFDRNDWIPAPESWAPNIVQGRGFDTTDSEGLRLWLAAEDRLRAKTPGPKMDAPARYGAEYLTRARLGQGAFRVLVTDAYRRRCAITGERTLPALDAAHIRPYAEQGPHLVPNGILLRADLHKLFDDGYITVTEDLHVVVSRRIKEEFENRRDYYMHDGQKLAVIPAEASERPARDFLRYHNEQAFLG